MDAGRHGERKIVRPQSHLPIGRESYHKEAIEWFQKGLKLCSSECPDGGCEAREMLQSGLDSKVSFEQGVSANPGDMAELQP